MPPRSALWQVYCFSPLSWIKILWRTLQESGFEIHLKYDVICHPRWGDSIKIEFGTEQGIDKKDLPSILKGRGFLCKIFLSDIVVATSEFLKGVACAKPISKEHTSKSKQSKEAPIQNDYQVWIQFWKHHIAANFELTTPLGVGEWFHWTERVWEWFYDHEDLNLQRQTTILPAEHPSLS